MKYPNSGLGAFLDISGASCHVECIKSAFSSENRVKLFALFCRKWYVVTSRISVADVLDRKQANSGMKMCFLAMNLMVMTTPMNGKHSDEGVKKCAGLYFITALDMLQSF